MRSFITCSIRCSMLSVDIDPKSMSFIAVRVMMHSTVITAKNRAVTMHIQVGIPKAQKLNGAKTMNAPESMAIVV